MKVNSEDQIQIYLVSFFRKLQLIKPLFSFWHTPNGGNRSAREGAKFKLMGVLAGVPDIQVISANGCAFIELKDADGRLSQPQKDFIADMQRFKIACHLIKASDPMDAIHQAMPIMAEIGYSEKDLAAAALSVSNSLARLKS